MSLLQRCISSEPATMMYSFVKYTVNDTSWSQIVSSRESVLCSHITSRSRKARVRSRRTNNAENIGFFRILIDPILWQILVRTEKLEFALFASMYARRSLSRIRCISFLIDFSTISHFSHFVGTSCESSTVKSHRYWTDEIAMWNERSETSMRRWVNPDVSR